VPLLLWRSDPQRVVVAIDRSPTGDEEQENLFNNPVDEPSDLNSLVVLERRQDMSERLIFADRAFFITMIWVLFLVSLPIVQIGVSFWGKGLTDPQFITVVTTTTAGVFGFWLLVGRYLYQKGGSSEPNGYSTTRKVPSSELTVKFSPVDASPEEPSKPV
jgi:hypothetical protein